MITDKSQGNVATCLRYDGLFSYLFAINLLLSLLVKNIKISKHLAKLHTKKFTVLLKYEEVAR